MGLIRLVFGLEMSLDLGEGEPSNGEHAASRTVEEGKVNVEEVNCYLVK
jgi:hypothetical protein